MISKLFEKILLARILHEVSEGGLMRDELFWFRPRHNMSLQLARLFERITRNCGEKMLTGAVFLDVVKTFDTVWIDGLFYRLTLLNFQSYIVHKSHRTSGVGSLKRLSRRSRHLVEACGLECLRMDLFPLSSSVCISTTYPHTRTTSSWPSTRITRPS